MKRQRVPSPLAQARSGMHDVRLLTHVAAVKHNQTLFRLLFLFLPSHPSDTEAALPLQGKKTDCSPKAKILGQYEDRCFTTRPLV